MNQINVKKLISYWTEGSLEDLQTSLGISKELHRHLHALFFLHLSIEKILKALFVSVKKQHAPLSHNLVYLASILELNLTKGQMSFLGELSEYNIQSRYPDERRAIKDKIKATDFKKYYKQAVEFHTWISQKLKDSSSTTADS